MVGPLQVQGLGRLQVALCHAQECQCVLFSELPRKQRARRAAQG